MMPELGELPMAEPTIICPNCKTEIKLTESLAALLIEAIRLAYEQRLAQKDAAVAKRDSESSSGEPSHRLECTSSRAV